MKRIQKRIEGEEEKCREENIQSLTNMLKEMKNINCETTWAQAQQLLTQNPSFQKYLSFMDKDDALCVFSSHICGLIDEYQKIEEQNEISKLRNERKNREKFQELLVEFRQSGIITLKTKWKDISPLICKEDIFKDLLLQSGPTPIDFFKFFMIDWNAEFKNNLDFVLELMNKKNFTFNLTTSYELFIAFIESNSKTSQVNKENYQYIYDSLFQDLIERTSKQENAKEKLRKTIVAQFRKLESNPNIKFRDIEAVLRYFKTKWNINKNVEGIVLKLHMEYLGQEDGELMYEKRDKRNYSNSYRSFNNSSEKERENQKRYHYSDREYNNQKKHHHHHHRHRSSPSEDEDYHHHRRHRESPSSNYRNHQRSYRKY
uniref:FF domain-containing protein n=1 Tax=Panagrolaimus davidi TaxID=227884 RepID=A0A914PKD1_9BILA